jgi:hypothetical protein
MVVDTLSRRDTETTAELAAMSAPSFTVLKGEHWWIIDDLITAHSKVYVPLESPALAGRHTRMAVAMKGLRRCSTN